MAKYKGVTVSMDEVSQTIDFKKITGVDLSDNPDLVREIGQATIDYMLKRVDNGKGIGNQTLPKPYSKSYSESAEFKAAEKSRYDVNMHLSGDMLGSVEGDVVTGSKFKFAVADDESAKAYGHMTGFKGHPTIGRKNADGVSTQREFFGVTEDEIKKKILPKFKTELADMEKESLASKVINAADLFRFEED